MSCDKIPISGSGEIFRNEEHGTRNPSTGAVLISENTTSSHSHICLTPSFDTLLVFSSALGIPSLTLCTSTISHLTNPNRHLLPIHRTTHNVPPETNNPTASRLAFHHHLFSSRWCTRVFSPPCTKTRLTLFAVQPIFLWSSSFSAFSPLFRVVFQISFHRIRRQRSWQ